MDTGYGRSIAIERSRRALVVSTVVSSVRTLVYSCVILGGLIVNPVRLLPQTLMRATASGGSVQLIGNDSAVLEIPVSNRKRHCLYSYSR